MDEAGVRGLLERVRSGEESVDAALESLKVAPFADLGFARVDHHRSLRQPVPEAVFGPGKTPEQCAAIVAELLSVPGSPVVLTRADAAQTAAAMAANPGGEQQGATVVWRPAPARSAPGSVAVVTAGTSDLPVAEECAAVLRALGHDAVRVNDCGVAGLHRIAPAIDGLRAARVVVVVAGMDGALPSVVGGLVPGVVVAVPTSVGYGSALEGLTPLLSMLASCAAGVAVVGIDNGFGAACVAARALAASDRP